MVDMRCISCSTSVLAKKNFVRFNCPNCGKVEIARCSNCKKLGNNYTCPACNFTGP